MSHRIVTFGYLTQWLGEPTEGGPISVTILRAPLCKPRNAREYALKCIFYRFALAEMGKKWYFFVISITTKNDDNASAKHPSNETAPVPILIEKAYSCRSGWFGGKSKHLKGRLGPASVTSRFLDQRRSVGTLRQ